jgi:hypothetical protein
MRLPAGIQYVFAPLVTRPVALTPGLEFVLTHLPLPWLAPYLPIILVIVFLFLIIVII